MPWDAVEAALPEAKSIAYDGCHKIYVLLDDEQTAQMEFYGYRENDMPGGSRLFLAEVMDKDAMLATLHDWWDRSCRLRFISSVRTNHADPNAGFTALITQFEE